MTHPENNLPNMNDVVDPYADEIAANTMPALLPPHVSGPSRPQLFRKRILLLGLAVTVDIAMVALMGVRADLFAVSPQTLTPALLLPITAAVVATNIATKTGPSRVGWAESSLVISLTVPLALFVASAFVPIGTHSSASFFDAAAMCVAGTAMLLFFPLATAIIAYRHSFVTSATWRTAALGVASGAIATAVIELKCSVSGVMHVLIAHGSALLIGGVMGYLLSRFTRV